MAELRTVDASVRGVGAAVIELRDSAVRPVLKWAGGKTQLLPQLLPLLPQCSGKYIEPFFGGGALYFALDVVRSVISDNNPELVNLYISLSHEVDNVITALQRHKNTEDYYYRIRAQRWEDLPPAEAAARTIFLNKTCYNGLYRVNRRGEFNTPYGHLCNPKIVDESNLYAASRKLASAEIKFGDYRSVLMEVAEPGDTVFLDPPYLPVSQYADFKRYTKEQFTEENHRELAFEVRRLTDLGCRVILTNSNHPLVYELYEDFDIRVHSTKRNISSNGNGRKGEDVIVVAMPK